jgi:hypothetical protein
MAEEFDQDEIYQLFVSVLVREPSVFTKESTSRRNLLQKLWGKMDDDSKRRILVTSGFVRLMDAVGFPYRSDHVRIIG